MSSILRKILENWLHLFSKDRHLPSPIVFVTQFFRPTSRRLPNIWYISFPIMTKCSVCAIEIEENYCPRCGQYYTTRRITNKGLFLDIIDGLFSLEKSLTTNLKIGILSPDSLVQNYWKGYRRYYFSPGKFLTIALFFLLINFLVQDNFFVVTVASENIGPNFLLLFLALFLNSLASWIVYVLYKKNFNEHFVMNMYTLSLWTILLAPFSVLWGFIGVEYVEQISTFLYVLIIGVWNNRVFSMVWWKRVIYILLHYMVFTLLLYGLDFVSDWDASGWWNLLSVELD